MASSRVEITEKQFMESVIELAKTCGWPCIYHTHDSRRSSAGFPDLVLIRPPRIIFAEFKKDAKAKTTDAQDLWLAALAGCPGVEAYVWRPDDFPEIVRALKRPRGRR